MATTTFVTSQGTLGTTGAQTISLEAITGLSVSEEKVKGGVRVTTFNLANVSLIINDTNTYIGTKFFTFPEGFIGVLNAWGNLTFTTHSTLSSTLNASSTGNWSMGTVTASAGALSSTMVNFIPSTNFTSSATIDVANTATVGTLASPANFDGHTTAVPAFFNIGVASSTDIDGDATVLVNGTIVYHWLHYGDC